MKKYPSKYSNGKTVSAAQYITEIICEKRAKFLKKDIGYKFWTNKEWAAFYRNQISSANQLVKKYDEVAVIKALNNPKTSKIYSLRAPHLLPIIEQEAKELSTKNNKLTIEFDRKESVVFNKKDFSNKKGIISKLKELDNNGD